MKKITLFLLFFAFAFYCFGAGMLDSFGMYHTWLFIGEAEFAAMHKAAGERIVAIMVVPMILLTGLCVLLYWHRPAAVPKNLVTWALVSLLTGWASSVMIQIPIQLKLDSGKDMALLQRLIATDWIRIAAWASFIAAVVAMMARLKRAYEAAVR